MAASARFTEDRLKIEVRRFAADDILRDRRACPRAAQRNRKDFGIRRRVAQASGGNRKRSTVE